MNMHITQFEEAVVLAEWELDKSTMLVAGEEKNELRSRFNRRDKKKWIKTG